MSSAKFSAKRIISALALSSCLWTGMPVITWADSNPGLTLFSGVKRDNLLSYNLQFGGRPNAWDRYKLYIPGKKMTQGASKFYIDYPDYYEGKFDPDAIEVRVKGESVPIREVFWDKESRIIEIDLEKPILESNKVEIVLSNVKNPSSGGTFYFNCQAMAAGDIPLRVYLGTWVLTIQQ